MDISVVVVAHNEERHIARCLGSILAQQLQPAEVVVVAHNCTDQTHAIVREQFPTVRLVPFAGERGTVFAHQKGFDEARYDITAHIDGDAYAENNRWLGELVAPLADPAVAAVAGVGIYHGNWFVRLGSWAHYYLLYGALNKPLGLFVPKLRRVIFWSSNFACRKSDFVAIGGLGPLIAGRRAGDEWCEDYYLSLMLARRGRIVVAPGSVVHAASKQVRVRDSLARIARQQAVEHHLNALVAKIK